VNLEPVWAFLRIYTWFWPAVAASVVVSLVLIRPVAVRLGTSHALAWTILLSLGFILSATLTPAPDALAYGAVGSGTCDVSRVGPASLKELLSFTGASMNMVLLIPLGLTIGLLPQSRAKAAIVAGAIALPVFIELIQLFATPLARACQSADVADNLTGLAIGLAIGLVAGGVARLAGSLRRRRPEAADMGTRRA
jgi:VanZ like family